MAGEDYVPRPEFEMFCRATNGGIARIEKAQIEGAAGVNEKLDQIISMLGERVTWEAHDRHKAECKIEMDKLKGRPSWGIALIITTLTGGLGTTLTLLLTGVIR